ncbi:MAG: oligosaccharide flippase family protein, partial [Chloroflexota bacterium]
KQIARNPERLNEYLGTALFIVMVLIVLTFGAVLGLSFLGPYTPLQIQIISLVGFAAFFRVIYTLTTGALGGLERFDLNSIALTTGRVLFTVVTIGALLINRTIYAYVYAVVAVTVFEALLIFGLMWRAIRPRLSINFSLIPSLLRAGVPYFFSALFFIGYKSFDMIIMSNLIEDSDQLGWYSAADRIFGTLMFIPAILITALFPVLARMHDQESEDLSTYIRKSFSLLFLFSVPIGFGVASISSQVVTLLWGPEYANSGLILMVYGIVIVFTYQTTLLGQFLVSVDRQNQWTWVMAIATLATFGLDLVLVPLCFHYFGVAGVGGALAYVVTEGGMMLAAIYLLPREYLDRSNLTVAIRTILAGLFMVGTVLYLNSIGINLFLQIAGGGAVYLLAILVFRAIPVEERTLIFNKIMQVLPVGRRGA